MPKKSHLRETFDKQYGKRAQTLLKSAWHHVYHVHWSLARKLSWKKSLLLTCQIMGLLFNTFAANEKYLLLHRENLTTPIQMQLSRKKSFFLFFSRFLKCIWNFERFEKKDDPHSFCISQITDSENVVR